MTPILGQYKAFPPGGNVEGIHHARACVMHAPQAHAALRSGNGQLTPSWIHHNKAIFRLKLAVSDSLEHMLQKCETAEMTLSVSKFQELRAGTRFRKKTKLIHFTLTFFFPKTIDGLDSQKNQTKSGFVLTKNPRIDSPH